MSPSCESLSDKTLANIFLELEQADFAQTAVDEVLRRHPDLAEQIRGLIGMRRKVEDACPDSAISLPERIGPFRIVRVLAIGGMGIVCEAIQDELERRVALKLIRPGSASEQAKARFRREQRVLGHLHQTHIVPVHTAGEEKGLQYFAMPLVEGATLHSVLGTIRTTVVAGSTARTGNIGSLVHSMRRGASHVAFASTILSGDLRAMPAAANGTRLEAPVVLSADYLRSAAAVMADVAEALQHVHDAGVLHRDLKPSNIMVDEREQSWIIDFGLAGRRGDIPEPAEAHQIRLDDLPEVQTSVLGTPQYMAPEQFQGTADVRSDVWGVGVTLYELLTLRAAFRAEPVAALAKRVADGSYTAPRRLVPNLPRDLEAIVMKTMQRDPDNRYQTAQELADELRRWLGSEPVKARPARPIRRAWLWARRNRGWATAIAVLLIAGIALGLGGFFHQKVRAAEAEQRRQESDRELAVQRMQRIRLTPHIAGWSDDVWAHVRGAARIRRDDALRDEAAAGLAGVDAREAKRFGFGASAIAFSPQGDQLLIGGLGGAPKIWDRKADRLTVSQMAGSGPVAFLQDGTPVQLRAQSPQQFILWDVSGNRPVRRFDLPAESGSSSAKAEQRLLALSRDGRWAAAALAATDADGVIAVWDPEGRLVHRFEHRTTAMALSPDGTLLAAGDEEGAVSVWSVPEGNQIASLRTERNRIYGLDFSHDRQHRDGGPSQWLLAAGDAGGTIVVWDVDAQLPRSFCSGSHYAVHAVRFSPDGVTLASGGRGRTRLWDFRTGRTLLELESGDYINDLQFSPAGEQLATASAEPFGSPQVRVWDLERERGIHALRGLSGQISKVCLSEDATLLAALAHNWQVGVWELPSGRLRAVFDAPKGEWADNAALALSRDGRRLAFSAGREAKLWDLTSGNVLGAWSLPPGLVDNLGFHPSGRLLLSRVETRDGKLGPYSNAHPLQHPRVLRIRDLAAPQPLAPLAEVANFNWHVFCAATTRNGEILAVEGLQVDGADRRRIVGVFDGLTGQTRWSMQLPKTAGYAHIAVDSADSTLTYLADDQGHAGLVALPEGVQIGTFGRAPLALGPRADLVLAEPVRSAVSTEYGYSLFQRDRPELPLVTLGIDYHRNVVSSQFSRDGRLVAWGTEEGVVLLFDLVRIQERLATVGLGW